MTLKAKLDNMKQESLKKIPPEILEKMQQASKLLEETVSLATTLKKGDVAPNFTLKDERGLDVELATLCAKGTVILSFYRGVW